MSHPKDIDPQRDSQRDDAHQGAEDEARLMLLDLLYGELEGEEQERAERQVREDETLAGELEGWGRVRELMRELPEEEPPEALSAALLHAAAAGVEDPSTAQSEHGAEDGAAARAVAAHGPAVDPDGEGPRSLWSRLKDLFTPVMLHPGLAAAASLVLVAGVAGALYVSGRSPAVDMRAPSTASAPASGSTSPSELAKKESAALDGLAGETWTGGAAGEPAAEAEDTEADLATGLADKDEAAARGGRLGSTRGRESKSAANERTLRQAAEGASGGAERRRASRSPAKKRSKAKAETKAKLDSYRKGGLAEKRADRKQKSAGPGGVFGGGLGAGSAQGGVFDDEAQNQAPAGSGSGRFADPPPPPRPSSPAPASKKPRSRPARPAADSAAPSAPAPAPPAEAEEEAPSREAEASAPRQEPSTAPRDDRASASDDASGGDSDTRTRAERLYRRARIAASKDDCVTVTKLATQVRRLDATFYKQVFARNKALRACLAAKNATKQ